MAITIPGYDTHFQNRVYTAQDLHREKGVYVNDLLLLRRYSIIDKEEVIEYFVSKTQKMKPLKKLPSEISLSIYRKGICPHYILIDPVWSRPS